MDICRDEAISWARFSSMKQNEYVIVIPPMEIEEDFDYEEEENFESAS